MLSAGGVLDATGNNRNRRTLTDFTLPSEPGNERRRRRRWPGR